MHKYDHWILTKSQFLTFFLITIIYSLKDPVQGVHSPIKKTANTHLTARGGKAAGDRWGSFLWAEIASDHIRKRMTWDLEHEGEVRYDEGGYFHQRKSTCTGVEREVVMARCGKKTGPPGALSLFWMGIQIPCLEIPPKDLHGSQKTLLVEKVTHVALYPSQLPS